MIKPINWNMVKHPANWVTFLLMVVIAGAIGHLFLTYVGIEPDTKSSAYDNVPAGQSPGDVATGAILPQSAEV